METPMSRPAGVWLRCWLAGALVIIQLIVSKTNKKKVFDFKTKKTHLVPLSIAGEVQIKTFKFLGTTISRYLKWNESIEATIKKAHQRVFVLRQLKKFNVSQSVLTQFYCAAIESILTFSVTVSYSSARHQDKDKLDRRVRTASETIGSDLSSIASVYYLRSDRKLKAIVQDTPHPANHLIHPLPSGHRYRIMRARTSRFPNSFYCKAIRSFNG